MERLQGDAMLPLLLMCLWCTAPRWPSLQPVLPPSPSSFGATGPQPLRQIKTSTPNPGPLPVRGGEGGGAHHRLVLRAVAQEDVILKLLLHHPTALALTLGSIMRGSGWNVTRNRRGLTAKTRSHEGAGTVRRYAARRSITIRDIIIDCACRLKPGLRTAWSPGFSRLEPQQFMTSRIACQGG